MMRFKYILANIETYEPIMQSYDITGIISKLAFLTDDLINSNDVIKKLLNLKGYYHLDDYVIINLKSNDVGFSDIIEISGSEIRISYDKLVSNIKQSIRNIKISEIID